MLLVDEIDRADDEFEAFLLEVLSDFTISIPELGTVRATTPPLVVLTSNRTREVHDALKRRCLYHWLQHPDFDREVAILRRRLPEVTEQLAREVARATGEAAHPGPAQAAGHRRVDGLGHRAAHAGRPRRSTPNWPPARSARCSSTARTPTASRRWPGGRSSVAEPVLTRPPRDVVDTVLGFARTLRARRRDRLPGPGRGDAHRGRLARRPRSRRRVLGRPAHPVRRSGRPRPLRRRLRRLLRRRGAARGPSVQPAARCSSWRPRRRSSRAPGTATTSRRTPSSPCRPAPTRCCATATSPS